MGMYLAQKEKQVTLSRLDQQIAFVYELDYLKNVLRKTVIHDSSRPENSAEHSWHIALMAVVMAEYASDQPLDLSRVVKMLLVHDIVEIDAGDTYLYDQPASLIKDETETAAADRIFALLPDDQTTELRALWDEYEARQTPEARYAAAIDRLNPIMLNFATAGPSWKKYNITRQMVIDRCKHIAEGAPLLWDYALSLLDQAVERGYLAASTSPVKDPRG